MKKLCVLLVLLLWVAFSTATAFAAQVSTRALGNGLFEIYGVDFANIGGVKVTVTYTPPNFGTAPKVQAGSLITGAPGAMFMPNPNTPGQIIIAAIQASGAFTGGGTIATIKFDNPSVIINAVIPELTQQQSDGSLSTLSGTNIGASVDNSGSGSTTTGSTTTGSTTTGSTTTGSTTTGSVVGSGYGTPGAYLGTVQMPGESPDRPQETAKRDTTPPAEPLQTQQPDSRSTPQDSSPIAVASASTPDSKPAGEKKFTAYKSVLDEVHALKEVTPKTLVGAFQAFNPPGVRQEPPIALSDGTSTVKAYIDLPAGGKESPNFALKGAKLVSLSNDEKGKWVIEALPVKNANDVKITALQDNTMTEIPLVVAQPIAPTVVSKNGKLDAAAFDLFLKERGTEKAPQFDLNGDGVRNYIDDYIFTANYLLKNGFPKKGAETPAGKPVSGKEKQ